jgi:hypothetical protein
MRRATVLRSFCSVIHAAIPHHPRDPQQVAGEYRPPPLALHRTVLGRVPPRPYRGFVPPERQREQLVGVRQAVESLDRYEPVDLLQRRSSCRGEVEGVLDLVGCRVCLEDDRDHGADPCCPAGLERGRRLGLSPDQIEAQADGDDLPNGRLVIRGSAPADVAV